MDKYLITILIFCLVIIYPALMCFGQNNIKSLYRQFKSGYKQTLQRESPDNCVKYGFIQNEEMVLDSGQKLLQIMILRHQEVDLPKKRVYSFHEAMDYLAAYDTAGIVPIVCNPLQVFPGEVDLVHCSTLKRSIMTARKLFKDSATIASYHLFREFKAFPVPVPLVTLPINYWRFAGTLSWLSGLSSGKGETFSEARKRTEQAALFLEQKALAEEKVVFVGHGFFNAGLKKQLRENGWKTIHNGGFKHLGVSLLVKIVK